MRVMVTGGRRFSDMTFLFAVLDAISARRTITTIIHGCGEGTDAMADHWANLRGVPTEIFAPDWETYGALAAEPVRNTEMISASPDLVVAFPGGRHTAVCRRQAEVAGLRVFAPAYVRPAAPPPPAPEPASPEPFPQPESVAAPRKDEPEPATEIQDEPVPAVPNEPSSTPVLPAVAAAPAAKALREPQPVQVPLPSKKAAVGAEFVADSGNIWTRI